MPDLDIAAHWLIRMLERSAEGEEQVLAELLLFPELATLAHKERAARAGLLDLAGEWLAKQPPDEPARRVLPEEPEVAETRVEVPPGRESEAWRGPVSLDLMTVVWEQGGQVAARLPALDIAVIAPDRKRLPGMLREHALAAIRRAGWTGSLLKLAMHTRGHWRLEPVQWTPRLQSSAERWRELEETDDEKGDPLTALCTRLEVAAKAKAFEINEKLRLLARMLALPERTSVLLVGPAGAGKTALVLEMARRRAEFGLGTTAFYRTSGARLIAGACGFGMWQQRCGELINAAKNKPVVLYLGNLFELVNVGQSSAGSESIASFLRPHLLRREAQVIVECTDDQLAVIEKNEPRLGDAFRILRVEEPAEQAASAILLACSLAMGGDAARFTRPALARVEALHRRYAGLAAFPGAPLRFMRRLHEVSERGGLIEEEEVYAAFSKETGMPRALLDPAAPLDLSTMESWFVERVRGQEEAVAVVTGMIAQIKAGLTRPGRPLASLLFIGPTGTGKTELAKALAEFLFHSAERMIRLDMSEFGQPWSAERLVSGSHDGREGLLTAAVREQPFSVLLLDEFEKADPAVFDLLLQVLGEARLTDAAGRLADFSNCVVIMTSNLGAETFARGRLGFAGSGAAPEDAKGHFSDAVRRLLRPEMFNRIDRIVPFQALPAEVVRDLTRREIAAVETRAGLAGRGIRLEADAALMAHLARRGYDPRYGARPLKRRVAEELLAPLAAMLAEGVPDKSRVLAGLDTKETVTLRVIRPETSAAELEERRHLHERLRGAAELRRRYETLRASTMINSLTGRLRLRMQALRAALPRARRRRAESEWLAHDPELESLRACLRLIERQAETQLAHEEFLMLALHGGDPGVLRQRDPLSARDLEEAALTALALWQPPPERLVLVARGQPGARLLDFARCYRDLATNLGGKVSAGLFYKQTPPALRDDSGLFARADAPREAARQSGLWNTEPGRISAVALWITGGHAPLFLQHEGGLHVSKSRREKAKDEDDDEEARRKTKTEGRDWQCRLDIHAPENAVTELSEFLLPLDDLAGLPDLESPALRRQYDPVRLMVRDGPSGQRGDGEFSAAWLLRALREERLKEALA